MLMVTPAETTRVVCSGGDTGKTPERAIKYGSTNRVAIDGGTIIIGGGGGGGMYMR